MLTYQHSKAVYLCLERLSTSGTSIHMIHALFLLTSTDGKCDDI